MINNRQNGRRRGRGGNGSGGNNQRGGNAGRPDSGNRIDSRARGNANQLYEKYKNLARDAQMSGDRVNTEYYLQFADHYFRVLNETRTRFEEQNPNAAPQRRIQPVDSFDDFDGDDEFGEEGEPIRAGEQGGQEGRGQRDGYRDQPPQRAQGQQGPRYEPREQNGRDQNGRDPSGRPQGQRDDNRRDEPRFEGRPANPRRDDGRAQPQQDRYDSRSGRDGGVREGGEREEGNRPQEGEDRYAMTGSPVANDLGEDSPDGAEPTPIAPRRRGRPRRDAVAGTVAEVEAPAALDADRLPPSLSLSASPAEADDGGEAAKPRRRRTRVVGEASQPG